MVPFPASTFSIDLRLFQSATNDSAPKLKMANKSLLEIANYGSKQRNIIEMEFIAWMSRYP
jgi:hypothetical protein